MGVRFHRFRRGKVPILLGTCGLLLLAGSALTTVLLGASGPRAETLPAAPVSTPTPSPTLDAPTASPTSPTPTVTPVPHFALLDGVPLSDAEWGLRRARVPVAVMIDNAPPAFPQAGLDRADIVYEAFVEGGITRFMAVFWRNDADLVMPVRSARTPFVILAAELGALFGHAGGADTYGDANAVGQIYEWGIKDLEAFAPGSDVAYHRTPDRYAPYNLATSTGRLREAAGALAIGGLPTVASWRFRDDAGSPAPGPRAGGIEIDFQSQRYASAVIQWHWDDSSHAYLRFQSGGPHVDQVTKQQLRFKSVVVMRVPHRVADFAGHVVYDQFGEGPVSVFLDGRRVDGVWRKKDRADRTRFFDAAGQEIALERGPVFVELAGPASVVTVAETAAGLPPLPPFEPPGATPFVDPEPGPRPAATPTPLPSPTPRPAPSPAATRPVPTATPVPSPTPVPRTPTPEPTSYTP